MNKKMIVAAIAAVTALGVGGVAQASDAATTGHVTKRCYYDLLDGALSVTAVNRKGTRVDTKSQSDVIVVKDLKYVYHGNLLDGGWGMPVSYTDRYTQYHVWLNNGTVACSLG